MSERKRDVGLACPVCGGKTGVLDSRPVNPNRIRRRRSCMQCGHRLTTIELDLFDLNASDVDTLRRLRVVHRALNMMLPAVTALLQFASTEHPTEGETPCN